MGVFKNASIGSRRMVVATHGLKSRSDVKLDLYLSADILRLCTGMAELSPMVVLVSLRTLPVPEPWLTGSDQDVTELAWFVAKQHVFDSAASHELWRQQLLTSS